MKQCAQFYAHWRMERRRAERAGDPRRTVGKYATLLRGASLLRGCATPVQAGPKTLSQGHSVLVFSVSRYARTVRALSGEECHQSATRLYSDIFAVRQHAIKPLSLLGSCGGPWQSPTADLRVRSAIRGCSARNCMKLHKGNKSFIYNEIEGYAWPRLAA